MNGIRTNIETGNFRLCSYSIIYYSYLKLCDVKIFLVNLCLVFFVIMNGIRTNIEMCNFLLSSYSINYYTNRKLCDVFILVLAIYPIIIIIMYFKLSMFGNILLKNKIINMLLSN